MPKESRPLVSVVIPAWNSEGILDDAVASIVGQSYRNLEIIIINDASTDSTGSVADAWVSKDSRIRVVHNEKNLGIGANRDKGIKESRGLYICWQDADDISYPDRVEKQVKVLESDSSIGVVGGFLQFFDETGDGVVRTYSSDDESLRRHIFRYNPVAQPATMFRREVFEVVGSYDKSLSVSEDLDMMLRLGESFKFANIASPAIRYRQLGSSLTASKLKEMERTTLRLRRQFKNSPAYKWTLIDSVYNTLQLATIWIPVTVRMKLFAMVRGDKKNA